MTILVQGAMYEELNLLLEYFCPKESVAVAGYEFRICRYRDSAIVISKTEIGMMNASISTTLGIERFSPDLVINQGCAGAHVAGINIGDLIIGAKAVHINDFHSPAKQRGAGSNSLDWQPSKRARLVDSTPEYVGVAESLGFDGKKYTGIVGSGDMLSRETDRIEFLHGLFGELSEDMESAAALTVCEKFGTDRIALRIISNNELTGRRFDYGVCETLQRFVINFIDKVLQ